MPPKNQHTRQEYQTPLTPIPSCTHWNRFGTPWRGVGKSRRGGKRPLKPQGSIFPFNGARPVRFQSRLEVGPRPAGLCLSGYMVNHRLTVEAATPTSNGGWAAERRAVHCYYVAHRSVWLIIGSACVIQLLKLCLQAFERVLYTIPTSFRVRAPVCPPLPSVYIGTRLRSPPPGYYGQARRTRAAPSVSEFNKIRDHSACTSRRRRKNSRPPAPLAALFARVSRFSFPPASLFFVFPLPPFSFLPHKSV